MCKEDMNTFLEVFPENEEHTQNDTYYHHLYKECIPLFAFITKNHGAWIIGSTTNTIQHRSLLIFFYTVSKGYTLGFLTLADSYRDYEWLKKLILLSFVWYWAVFHSIWHTTLHRFIQLDTLIIILCCLVRMELISLRTVLFLESSWIDLILMI